MGFRKSNQYLISFGVVLATALVCYFLSGLIDHRVVALILMVVVSILAMVLDIFPVLAAALLSALIWNFFFIPPTFTLQIRTPEDALMFLMYFLIASINAVLTYKIREFEKKARDREEKENTIKLYNTILNSLSHELRTPLATVIGAVDTIKNDLGLPEKVKSELISEIDVAAMRLDRQVENLLNMGRIESGVLKPKPDWCDINELINSILFRLKSEQGDHALVYNSPDNLPLYWLDQGLVEQIVVNIVRNGIQHTPENSIITIQVMIESAGCCIQITDNGNGFKNEDLKFVFDKFFRAHNAKTGGTGLGLSIAKGFADAMRGRIEVENLPERGAKFSVYLPAESNSLSYHEND